MIKLVFEQPTDSVWIDWVEEGARAAQELLEQAPADRQIDERLYRRQRERFLEASFMKCAYCEVLLLPGQRRGDVEHYRPKGRVRDGSGNLVATYDAHSETTRHHPGYFWLAYEWRNLLPSCLACNRRAYDAFTGEQSGKGDYFPTLDGNWAWTPDDLELERPALLNPWIDDAERHLHFDIETGMVGGLTERGTITIDLLGLNREGLPESRLEACVDTSNAFLALALRTLQTLDGNSADFDSLMDPDRTFAAFRQTQVVVLRRYVHKVLC